MRARILHGRCRKTGKVRFPSELEASLALATPDGRDRGECRAYRCPSCRCWHLTSMPLAGRRTA